MMRPTLRDTARRMGIDAAAVSNFPTVTPPVEAVRRLLDDRQFAVALRLVAGVLPRGYLIAWACQCVRQGDLSVIDAEGVAFAETCVRERQSPPWKAALSFAARHGFMGVGPMLAAGAGWSVGALVDGDGKTMGPAPDGLAPRMAAGAVVLAAMPPADFESRCRAYAAAALTLLPTEDA